MNPKVSKTSRREYIHLSEKCPWEEFIPATYMFSKLNKAELLKTLSHEAEEQIFPSNKCFFTAISNSIRLAWMFLEGPDCNNA